MNEQKYFYPLQSYLYQHHLKNGNFRKTHMPPKQDQINSRKLTRNTGTSLAVHWSRLHVSTSGARVWSLVRKLRSCMPCHMAQKREIIHNTLVDLESGRVCRLAVPGIMWGTTIRMKRQYKIAISHYCNQVDVTLTRSGSNLRWCQG